MLQRKGDGVSGIGNVSTLRFNWVTNEALQSAGDCLGGGIVRNKHGTNKQRRKVEWYHDAGTWLSVLNHFPSSDPASVDQVRHWKPDPSACNGRCTQSELGYAKSLDTGHPWRQVLTHTHTHPQKHHCSRSQQQANRIMQLPMESTDH